MHKTTYFIDSNVFVYAKIGDKKYGKCSQEIIKAIYKGKIEAIIDTVVLLEVANALRKLKVKDVEEEILAILSLPIQVVEVTKEDIIQAVKEDDLSPYDALHYVISKKSSAIIITADQDFKERIDPCSFSL
ncbi:MAG: PIN domain-containing protein [Acidianus infernus]|uniref:type II toxin-antitoxin system VapC family toxin n=1 Tax=Acidianus infernus TaxID=12915 RepID=UPI002274C869|nr:PIN domain-containing protein [Acidianus infernus]